jgi:hypothetical protein
MKGAFSMRTVITFAFVLLAAVAIAVPVSSATSSYSYPSYTSPSYGYSSPSYSYPSYTSPSYGYSSSSYYGQPNAAGFPKNQYVSPYVTKSGRYVGGYYRNSPSDGLPTCSIVRC